MWPTVFSIGPVALHSFGLLVALGVFFGGFVLWQKTREEGFDEEAVMDSWLIAGLSALLLGRLVYVLLNWDWFGGSWYKILFLTKFPGLSYEGVWLGAVLAAWGFCLVKKWDVWRYSEAAVLAWLTAEIFAWGGSFLAGSNLGRPTNWWWGLSFPGVDSRRQPVHLLFILLLFLLTRLLKKWEKEYRGFKWYQQKKGEALPGFLLAIYLMGLGLIRFGLGFWLEGRRLSWGLSLTQWFGLVLALGGGLLLLVRSGIKIDLRRKPRLARNREKPSRIKTGFDYGKD
jgi:phosphatidylglycerol:prolipoprotein diacylglycerol transferase